MGLNKSKGNMFDWITHTWNPIAGRCTINCSYCSTNKLRNRYHILDEKYSGPMRLVERELTSLGKNKFIFVAAQNDLFADGVDDKYIIKVLEHCNKFDNKYLIQTKRLDRAMLFLEYLTDKFVLATTIESNIYYKNIMGIEAYDPNDRFIYLKYIQEGFPYIPLYLTIEPVIDFDDDFIDKIKKINFKQITIGADTGNNNLPEPNKEKTHNLINELKKDYKIKIKDNLKRLM